MIAVGATDHAGVPTGFSTRGDHVALCAPGARILTTSLSGYQFATGTSFAAPFVTATVGLMVSRALRRARALDTATVRSLLVRSVRPFGDGAAHPGCGAGVLDAAAALQALDAMVVRTPIQPLGPQGGHYAH